MLDTLLRRVPNQQFAEALATYFVRLPAALVVTLNITLGATVIALVLGVLVALGRGSGTAWVARFFSGVIYVGRCIPLPPLQFLAYFLLLSVLPIEPATAGMLAIGLQFTPYTAELLRSGISAVPKGQIEAAQALGCSAFIIRRRLILPLALRLMMPAIGQQMIGVLLTSAFVSQIGARDVTGMGRNVINAMFTTDLWLVIAATYFVLAFPISRLLIWLESRLTAGL